ncbi:hypothetical protein THOM_1822 [Trachipleistophora hominis]|uniref:Uncharacterized protein n=1 Tax=Trachipleistophora hominis TaxID=72359 RepID=L7JUX3_TRAHO|nr:hypothetical protein THOM_1822 [Trachipleistophora hominis]
MDNDQFNEIEQNLQNVLSSLIEAFETIKEPYGGINEIKNAVESLKKVQEGLISVYENNSDENKEIKTKDNYME